MRVAAKRPAVTAALDGLDWIATQLPGVVNLSFEFRISVGNPDVALIQTKISALRSAGFEGMRSLGGLKFLSCFAVNGFKPERVVVECTRSVN